jgi:hypothetical protein
MQEGVLQISSIFCQAVLSVLPPLGVVHIPFTMVTTLDSLFSGAALMELPHKMRCPRQYGPFLIRGSSSTQIYTSTLRVDYQHMPHKHTHHLQAEYHKTIATF